MPEQRLRIAVLGSAASPHDSSRAAIFSRLGHDVTMISMTKGVVEGVRLRPVWGGGVRPRALRRLAIALGTTAMQLTTRADIWHAHYAAEYGTWIAALLRRRPLVITVMGGDVLFDEQGSQGWLARRLTRHALHRADLLLVKSDALGDVVAGFGVPRERIMRVIWGIDRERFRANPDAVARLRQGWGGGSRPVILAPRALQPFYNHQLLMEALPKVIATGYDPLVVFSLMGVDDRYREQLVERARALGIADRLRFEPPRAAQDMASLYAAADLVVSLAPSDGMPQTPLEAGAVERPTLMTDLERYRELFTDGVDVLLTPLEPATVADRISRLLGDAPLRARIAAGAHALMLKHADLERDAERVEAAYCRLLSARAGRR